MPSLSSSLLIPHNKPAGPVSCNRAFTCPGACFISALRRNETTKDATEGCDEAVEAAKKGEKVAGDQQSQHTSDAGTSDKQRVS